MILPSKFEAQPLVVLEATVLKKYVLLTDLPTLRITYKNFNNVIYCHPNKKILFEKELINFYESLDIEKEVNINNLSEIFTWEDVGKKIYEVYERILK